MLFGNTSTCACKPVSLLLCQQSHLARASGFYVRMCSKPHITHEGRFALML